VHELGCTAGAPDSVLHHPHQGRQPWLPAASSRTVVQMDDPNLDPTLPEAPPITGSHDRDDERPPSSSSARSATASDPPAPSATEAAAPAPASSGVVSARASCTFFSDPDEAAPIVASSSPAPSAHPSASASNSTSSSPSIRFRSGQSTHPTSLRPTATRTHRQRPSSSPFHQRGQRAAQPSHGQQHVPRSIMPTSITWASRPQQPPSPPSTYSDLDPGSSSTIPQ
ncbi:hypothetical protein ACLOJK_038760, partial [Asimina triloba]